MALLQCPECGGKVSSSAPACPHCGYAMQQSGADLPGGSAVPDGSPPPPPGWRPIVTMILYITGFILVLYGGISLFARIAMSFAR